MPPKPTVGQSSWGPVLNAYLDASHNTDGTLKESAINAAATTLTAGVALAKRSSAGITLAADDSPQWMKDRADFHPDFSGSDSDHLQSAIDEGQTYWSGEAGFPPVTPQPGTYHLTGTTSLKSAGLIGPALGSPSVNMLWDGPTNIPAFTKAFGHPGNQSFADIVGIRFNPGTAEPDIWLDLYDVDDTPDGDLVLDVFFNMQFVQFHHGRLQVRCGSWINVQWEHLRFDGWRESAIELNPQSFSSLGMFSIHDFTCDNQGGSVTTGQKSFINFTAAVPGANAGVIALSKARIEVNHPLLGIVTTTPTASSGVESEFELHLSDVTMPVAGTASNVPILYRDTPDTNGEPRLVITNLSGSGFTDIIGGNWWSGVSRPLLSHFRNGFIPFLEMGSHTGVQGGQLLYNVGNAPAAPTNGGVLYVEGGALKYKGSAGTVTTLGPA